MNLPKKISREKLQTYVKFFREKNLSGYLVIVSYSNSPWLHNLQPCRIEMTREEKFY